jgi:hypothetical protein
LRLLCYYRYLDFVTTHTLNHYHKPQQANSANSYPQLSLVAPNNNYPANSQITVILSGSRHPWFILYLYTPGPATFRSLKKQRLRSSKNESVGFQPVRRTAHLACTVLHDGMSKSVTAFKRFATSTCCTWPISSAFHQ